MISRGQTKIDTFFSTQPREDQAISPHKEEEKRKKLKVEEEAGKELKEDDKEDEMEMDFAVTEEDLLFEDDDFPVDELFSSLI